MFTRTFALGFALVVAMGCDGESTEADCTTVKPYSQIQGAFNKCTACHSSALTDLANRGCEADGTTCAPLEYNYDNATEAAKFPEKALATLADDATIPMPPADETQLTAQELTDMKTWFACDTPP